MRTVISIRGRLKESQTRWTSALSAAVRRDLRIPPAKEEYDQCG